MRELARRHRPRSSWRGQSAMKTPQNSMSRTATGGRVLNSTGRIAAGPYDARVRERTHMLTTVVIVLLILWLLGVVTSFTAGGLIHVLLVIAVVVVLLRIIQGRNPLRG